MGENPVMVDGPAHVVFWIPQKQILPLFQGPVSCQELLFECLIVVSANGMNDLASELQGTVLGFFY